MYLQETGSYLFDDGTLSALLWPALLTQCYSIDRGDVRLFSYNRMAYHKQVGKNESIFSFLNSKTANQGF